MIIPKKGHNSKTLLPELTKSMSWTFTHIGILLSCFI